MPNFVKADTTENASVSLKDGWLDWLLLRIFKILNRAKILTRLDRLKLGNFGDCKALQEGVCELRIHYGPGIRIYYGKIGNKVILLLCGSDKGSQDKDIEKAKEYLKDYQSRELGHGKK